MTEYPYYGFNYQTDGVNKDNLTQFQFELEINELNLADINYAWKYVSPTKYYYLLEKGNMQNPDKYIERTNGPYYEVDNENIPFNPFDIVMIKKFNVY